MPTPYTYNTANAMTQVIAQHADEVIEAAVALLEGRCAGNSPRTNAANAAETKRLQDRGRPIRIRGSHYPYILTAKAEVACPLARYAGSHAIDVWYYQGVVYRAGDRGLCQHCEHQLACALVDQPKEVFKRVAPAKTKKAKAS